HLRLPPGVFYADILRTGRELCHHNTVCRGIEPVDQCLAGGTRNGDDSVSPSDCLARPLERVSHILLSMELCVHQKTEVVDRHHQTFARVAESRRGKTRTVYDIDLT